MGEAVLHPEHWLFKQFKHPMCPECRCEIVPMEPIDMEQLEDGKIMFRHEGCAYNLPDREPA